MTEDTQPGVNRKVRPATTRVRKGRAGTDPAEVQRLKTALFAALDRTGFNLKEIAEKCGRANANLLYNLKNGHSETLSVLTYVALARHLNLPISELLGMPDRTPTKLASARGSALIQVAVERVALSFALVRAATSQYYEQHVEPNDPARDQAAKMKLLSGFFQIDRGLDALAQDITELLDQLREIVPEIPPLPPL
jgi:transcriptional regulator with XRE-family HTH domain